jgi:hypothetical protein
MIMREWGEIRQLYKTCRPGLPRLSWSIQAVRGFAFILILIWLMGSITPMFKIFGFPVQLALVTIVMLLAVVLVFLFEKAFANEFKIIYATYGLGHYPWWRRRLYLHYALFLRALMDRTSPVSREMITRLRSFADIAEKPPPSESRLLQPAYIVPFIVLLNVLIAEILKRAELLKGQMGILTLISYVFFLWIIYVVITMGYAPIGSDLFVDRTIQRFLQWAEHDIEEKQLHRRRRLCEEIPGPHDPAY